MAGVHASEPVFVISNQSPVRLFPLLLPDHISVIFKVVCEKPTK